MLVRDGDGGLEVFMLQRTHRAAFARSQYVFPGGKVDEADHGDVFEPICDGLDDATASARMGLEHGGLAWLVAAARECFEEAGVLLARRAGDPDVVRFDDDGVADRFHAARRHVHDGTLSLAELCEREGLMLMVDRLHLVDHWVTPVGERRRFDTRFFVGRAPHAQEPLHDEDETIASLWVRPVDALRMWEAGDLQMFPPTVASLRFLEPHSTADAALTSAARVGIPPAVLPKLRLDEDGNVMGILRPDEPGYDALREPEFVIGSSR